MKLLRTEAGPLTYASFLSLRKPRDIFGFTNRLIPQLLSKENFPTPPFIERCHRSPPFVRQNSKAGPRPILVKFLHFQDTLKIMKLSRENEELVYNGTRVLSTRTSALVLFINAGSLTHLKRGYETWILNTP